jgi:hypothetical protein
MSHVSDSYISNMTPCSLTEVYRHFGDACLIILLLVSEDGGRMSLRSVDKLTRDYTDRAGCFKVTH